MKPFTTIAVVVFAMVAVLQLVRVVAAWPVSINGFELPISASVDRSGSDNKSRAGR